MAKRKPSLGTGKCLKDAILILAKSGLPAPGSGLDSISYVIKLDRKGQVDGVDVHIDDELLGQVLRKFTTP